MASLCCRAILQTCRRTIATSVTASASSKGFADPLDHATGHEKRELLAYQNDPDPYGITVDKRGAGTKDEPHIVYSAFDARIMGCICEEDQIHVNWMWIHKGQPRRCECGYWFKLVEKAPV
ncbi:cytochrome c oxidase subunit 5B, mitochondrial-like [Prorops nasuta]|uniref:cytochrome c oxidase subunit 5B, mitochondrial-like n=1 Tax=Prorops nasuta TaxID=863751 RepID=UPI0034CE87D0